MEFLFNIAVLVLIVLAAICIIPNLIDFTAATSLARWTAKPIEFIDVDGVSNISYTVTPFMVTVTITVDHPTDEDTEIKRTKHLHYSSPTKMHKNIREDIEHFINQVKESIDVE